MDKNRTEAFSDGVFAVAITLLVLDVNVAGPGHGSLAHQLWTIWPSYAAYAVSFLVIGIIWVNHHTLMSRLAKIDRPLLFLNLILLAFVTSIPFPTRLVAQYLRAGGWNANVAAAVYSGVMMGMGFAFVAIHTWAGRHEELLDESVDPVAHRAATRSFGIGASIYPAILCVAFVSAAAAMIAHFVVAGLYVFDRTGPVTPSSDRAA